MAKKIYKDNPVEGEKFVKESLAKIKTSTDPVAASKSADLVVEAIVENLGIKHELFKKLDAVSSIYYLFHRQYFSNYLQNILFLNFEYTVYCNFNKLTLV